MNRFQYEVVCQVKQEVLYTVYVIQATTVQNIRRGFPIPPVPAQLMEMYFQKLHFLRDVLQIYNISDENFNLTEYSTNCLRNADQQIANHFLAFRPLPTPRYFPHSP
ncbi:unnamed protein product [Caenorhabditis sp. 36 PRJEB53466]|nr:unnamed protein product [Caenorhabditis sp. 36 PRJEB53466]